LAVCTVLAAIHSLLASKPAKDLARRIVGPRYRNGLYRLAFNAKSVLFLVWATWWFLRLPDREIYRVRCPGLCSSVQAKSLHWAYSSQRCG
jgi:hypothetical protein